MEHQKTENFLECINIFVVIQMLMLFIAQKYSYKRNAFYLIFCRCPTFGKNSSELSLSFRVRTWDKIHVEQCFFLWSHIARLYYEDLKSGLELVNKPTSDHINLISYSVMRVNLAAQALSETVRNVLNGFGPEEAEGTGQFGDMMNKLFGCLNVRNTKERIIKRKPFLKPYESVDGIRFTWLDDFFQYFKS